eukprot:Clim_evm7s12 gene=Clim_evmTU7s12
MTVMDPLRTRESGGFMGPVSTETGFVSRAIEAGKMSVNGIAKAAIGVTVFDTDERTHPPFIPNEEELVPAAPDGTRSLSIEHHPTSDSKMIEDLEEGYVPAGPSGKQHEVVIARHATAYAASQLHSKRKLKVSWENKSQPKKSKKSVQFDSKAKEEESLSKSTARSESPVRTTFPNLFAHAPVPTKDMKEIRVPNLNTILLEHQKASLHSMWRLEENKLRQVPNPVYRYDESTRQWYHPYNAKRRYWACPHVEAPAGGILCLDTGTGKTLTMLAHIMRLIDRETVNEVYHCEDKFWDTYGGLQVTKNGEELFASDSRTRPCMCGDVLSTREITSTRHLAECVKCRQIFHVRCLEKWFQIHDAWTGYQFPPMVKGQTWLCMNCKDRQGEKTASLESLARHAVLRSCNLGYLVRNDYLTEAAVDQITEKLTGPFYWTNLGRRMKTDRPRRSATNNAMEMVLVSCAVLVVVPPNLLSHWMAELYKHFDLGDFAVISIAPGDDVPSAEVMRKQQIVFVTHDTMNQVYDPTRYANIIISSQKPPDRSEFEKVMWRSIVIDEGHGMSNLTTNLAHMLSQSIHAGSRWIVSATPLPSSHWSAQLEKADSFLAFLGVSSLFRNSGETGMSRSKWQIALESQDQQSIDLAAQYLQLFVVRFGWEHLPEELLPGQRIIARQLALSPYEYARHKELAMPDDKSAACFYMDPLRMKETEGWHEEFKPPRIDACPKMTELIARQYDDFFAKKVEAIGVTYVINDVLPICGYSGEIILGTRESDSLSPGSALERIIFGPVGYAYRTAVRRAMAFWSTGEEKINTWDARMQKLCKEETGEELLDLVSYDIGNDPRDVADFRSLHQRMCLMPRKVVTTSTKLDYLLGRLRTLVAGKEKTVIISSDLVSLAYTVEGLELARIQYVDFYVTSNVVSSRPEKIGKSTTDRGRRNKRRAKANQGPAGLDMSKVDNAYVTEKFSFYRRSKTENAYQYGQKLEAFAKDPNTSVLIMDMNSASYGINIICAAHMFILEPNDDLRTFHQAVNRIHRIGQLKEVHVEVLTGIDTVERRFATKNLSLPMVEERVCDCGAEEAAADTAGVSTTTVETTGTAHSMKFDCPKEEEELPISEMSSIKPSVSAPEMRLSGDQKSDMKKEEVTYITSDYEENDEDRDDEVMLLSATDSSEDTESGSEYEIIDIED